MSGCQQLPLDNTLRRWYIMYHKVHNSSTYLEYIDLFADKGA